MQPAIAPPPRLARATAQISIVNGVARALGFAKWVVFGLTVGLTFLGNTYQTANLVPNILFDLAVGGLVASVLVPTFVAELERDRSRATLVASALANRFLLLSLPLVAAGVLLAGPIMRAFTVGVADPAVRERQIELGSFFLYLFLPQVPMYLAGMVMRGILHAHHRFGAAAAAPAVQSIIVIGSYVWFGFLGAGADLDTVTTAQLWVLGGGTTAGVAAWTICQIPRLSGVAVRWRPALLRGDPAVARALRSGGWGLAFYAVTQAGLVVTLILANRIEGGVVAFQIAFAFFELPNALAGFPIATSLFPSLAMRAAREEVREFAGLFSRGWRAVSFLLAPAAVGALVVAVPVVDTIFRRTSAGADPVLVSASLQALALGLPAYGLLQLTVRAFYARHETRPPVVINGVAVGLASAGALVLTSLTSPDGRLAFEIIGGAHAAGQWAALIVAGVVLARRVPHWHVGSDVRALAGFLIRASLMGAAAWGAARIVGGDWTAVVAAVVAGAVVYGALTLPTREARRLIAPQRETD